MIELKPCECSKKFSLPMEMCNEEWTEHWVECDFCGNKTKKHDSAEKAIFKWNEFQYKKRKLNIRGRNKWEDGIK